MTARSMWKITTTRVPSDVAVSETVLLRQKVARLESLNSELRKDMINFHAQQHHYVVALKKEAARLRLWCYVLASTTLLLVSILMLTAL